MSRKGKKRLDIVALAERYIILSVNAVEIWGNSESRIRFGESETIWQKWQFCQIVYGEIDRK